MKTKQILLTLGLIGCISLVGFTRSVAQDVEVDIVVPYSGDYSYWTITFTNQSTGDQYTFYTDDTFDPGNESKLGTVPAGTYDINFSSQYYYETFDFDVVTPPDFDDYRSANGEDFTYYDAPIAEGSYLIIDDLGK